MALHTLHKEKLSELIKRSSLELGFFACGISKAGFLQDDARRVEKWLERERHSGMSYMERNREKRYDPSKLVENAKSVISVLYNYYPQKQLPVKNNYKISKYAYGKDYHYVIKEKLFKLLKIIEEKTGKRKARVFVDSAPVLDRAWAAKSVLGFVGKNTLLINRRGGSFFFIGEIILDLELKYNDDIDVKNYCGNCTACIDACPTNALKPFEVDAGRCISYLTIENNGEIADDFIGKFDDWIFGCDICQDVCPWNKRFATSANEPAFKPKKELYEMTKEKWERIDTLTFKRLFKQTPLERTGYKGLMRNIMFVSNSRKKD